MGRRRGTGGRLALLACAVVLSALLSSFVVDRRGLSSLAVVGPSSASRGNGNATASRRWDGGGDDDAVDFRAVPSFEGGGGPSEDPAEASCRALSRHMGGGWEHEHGADPDGPAAASGYYFPKELGWLRGEGSPSEWAECVRSTDGTMYQGPLGNQCGACGVTGFRPSHSTWSLPGEGGKGPETKPEPLREEEEDPPAIALVKRLSRRNQTLCIAGDSVDKQLYRALNNLLVRHGNLPGGQQHGYTVTTSERIVKVNYTAVSPTLEWVRGWMVMNDIPERTLRVRAPGGEEYSATVRMIKTYAWTPWNTLFMDECE